MSPFLLILLTACTEPVIDATSKESLKESSEVLADTLPKEQKKQFTDELRQFISWHHSFKSFQQKGDTDEIVWQRIASMLHGKNAEGFMLEYKKAQKIQALWHVEYYKQSQEPHKYGNQQRAKVLLDDYHIYTRADGKYYIKYTILNNSLHALREAIFDVVVASKNTKTTWEVDKVLRMKFPHWLQPGESAVKTIQLFGNYFDEAPEDMVLKKIALPNITYSEEDVYHRNGASKHNTNKIEYYQKRMDEYKEKAEFYQKSINSLISKSNLDNK